MSNKLKLGKFDLKTEISGITLTLPTDLTLQIETEVDKITLTSDTLIDLTEMQGNFYQILKNAPLQSDSKPGILVELSSIDSASLTSAGDSAILEAGLTCSVWQIGIPVPVPKFKTECVDWGLLGKHCVQIPDGIELVNVGDTKTHLFNEGLSAKIRFGLTTPDNKAIDIVQYETEVYPRGELGKFVNWLLAFVKGDLSHFATGQLRKIINDGNIKQTLPKNLDKYHPIIKTIQFIALSTGNLGVLASFEASLTEDELTEIISKSVA